MYGEDGGRAESVNPCSGRSKTELSYLRSALQYSYRVLAVPVQRLTQWYFTAWVLWLWLSCCIGCIDDIYIFFSSQEDVHCLQDTTILYEKASSARVNWIKSEAMLVGQWWNQAVPSLPGGLEWARRDWKCYPSCHIGEEFWSPITWLPWLYGTDSFHWRHREAW